MSVQVVVPWRPGCPHRKRAWEWVQKQYRVKHPNFQIVAGASFNGPWVKSLATASSINTSEAEIIVLADADVWCDGLGDAVDAVRSGAPWAIPHTGVYRLNETASRDVMAGGEWSAANLTERPYQGVIGGGIVVAPRETLVDIPLDPRFSGWGQEDASHGLALWHLAGEPWRGTAPLIHLFHPPQERMTRRYGSMEGRTLYQRYAKAARQGPAALRQIVEEARDVLKAHQSPGNADPEIGFRGENEVRRFEAEGKPRRDCLRDPAEAT